ncbi:Uncharacterised protein [Burkholderia pseudomallei]|nr:Uncharacterised protein [Burkholderia pseudomallei]
MSSGRPAFSEAAAASSIAGSTTMPSNAACASARAIVTWRTECAVTLATYASCVTGAGPQ